MIPEGNAAYVQEAVDGDVQAAYGPIIRSGDIRAVKELSELTGVRPNLSEEDVQEGYVSLFHNHDYENAFKLRYLTGVQPRTDGRMGEEVQELYKRCASLALVGDMVYLKGFIGAVPRMDEKMEEAVQEGYRYSVSHNHIEAISWLKEVTGIEPRMDKKMEKAVQDGYERCAHGFGPIIDAEKIRNFSGIAPSKKLLKNYPELKEALK